MMSLCRHLSAQEIVNWVTTADGCVHTDDTTKLSLTSCEYVLTPPTPTRQNSYVPSASAVCIGHMTGALNLQDLKMTDQKRSKTGKCRTWKMTDQIAGR